MRRIKTGNVIARAAGPKQTSGDCFVAALLAMTVGILATHPLWGATVDLTVDKSVVAMDDQVQLQVTVNGTDSAEKPQVANLEPFEVQNVGTSSQVTNINGNTTVSVVYSFNLTPKKLGNFPIGPAKVVVGQQSLESKSVTIQVVKASQSAVRTGNFQVVQEVDDKSPFVGQQILYTFRYLSHGRMVNPQLSLPEFKGLTREQIDKQSQYQKIINGVLWEVTELHFALFPQSPGPLTLEPATLAGEMIVERRRGRTGRFDDFFDEPFFGMGGERKPVRLHTEPILLNVKALPAGKPSPFSGLLGTFRLEASLSKNSLAVGDSTTLSIQISGQGNIRDAQLPPFDVSGLKTYDDQPVTKMNVQDGKIGGSKLFKKALVPLQEGRLSLPPLRVSYFDPKAGQYRFAEAPALTLNVTPGAGKEALAHVSATGTELGQAQKEIQVKGEDLMPIQRQRIPAGEVLGPEERRNRLAIAALFPLMYFFFFGYRRRREIFLRDPMSRRRSRAYRTFCEGAKRLGGASPLYENASLLLRDYLGDRLGFDGRALTPVDTDRKLSPHRLSAATIDGIRKFLERCDRGQFGGEAAAQGGEGALGEEAFKLVDSVEKELR